MNVHHLDNRRDCLRIFYTRSNLDEMSIVDEILYIAAKTAFPQLYSIPSDKAVIHSNILNYTIYFIFKLYFSTNYHNALSTCAYYEFVLYQDSR